MEEDNSLSSEVEKSLQMKPDRVAWVESENGIWRKPVDGKVERSILSKEDLLNRIVYLYGKLNELQDNNNNGDNEEILKLFNALHDQNKRGFYDPKETEKKRPGWAIAYGK
jgi:hypothetical protein